MCVTGQAETDGLLRLEERHSFAGVERRSRVEERHGDALRVLEPCRQVDDHCPVSLPSVSPRPGKAPRWSPAYACRRPPAALRSTRVRSGAARGHDHRSTPALDPLDFLALDALLDDEEKAIRDTVRQFVREHVLPEVGDWFEQGILPREVV